MISGKTSLLPLFGYPTKAFKAPLIYNPWFAKNGIDVVVVPMGIKPEDFSTVLRSVFKLTNIPGALVTMPHKVTTVGLLDDVSTAVKIAGACNAILKRPDGSLLGDIFDGTGFTRGLKRKGFVFQGAKCLVVGSGGVGSAIAASLAAEGVAAITTFDTFAESAQGLAVRLRYHYPNLITHTGPNDAAGYDLVVNATPLGLPGDPLPMDLSQLSPSTFVGEVVMKTEMTPLLLAARERGCRYQIGTEMLFEMIPAYLEFFGYGSATAEELRAVATIEY
ncbi:shikimate dehydrogenase [Rhodoferax sp. 4810]|nr:shikimate dehydrogenase [Rhodoferax jenense]